jgi:glycosyltransferase involved in cell wall biosynthesis
MLKILLNIPLSRFSGYGSDGIDLALALEAKGADVYLQPTNCSPPLPPEIAHMLTKRLEAPFDLLINHVDPSILNVSKEARVASEVTVGWTMWEMSTLDNLKGRSTLRKRLKNFDAVVGYSNVSVEALRPHVPKSVKLLNVQGGYNASLWPYLERDWKSPRFSFVMNGQLGARKLPWEAVSAFVELKDEHPEELEPMEMHLHTTVAGLPKMMEDAIPKLRIHYKTFTEFEMLEFYRSGHVLLAPSRGEGKNLPCLEMLSTGGSVIYTDWSGHQNWGSSQYGYPLDYALTPLDAVRVGPNCLWASPSRAHMKELMLHCFRNREEVKAKGILGSKVIPKKCSWDVVVERLFSSLRESLPGKGEVLYKKFQEAKDDRHVNN